MTPRSVVEVIDSIHVRAGYIELVLFYFDVLLAYLYLKDKTLTFAARLS